tara:strand:- start:1156 stop:1557 length:402 start_codon:yes stop_codon:yes gene_type:complete
MKIFLKGLIISITAILISLVININETYAVGNVDWFLVKENNDGKQWLDLGSIKQINNNEVSVLTKFFKNPSDNSSKGETNLYVMRINCERSQFKDISINGIPNFNANWQSSNNDELIELVINKSCKENNLNSK